MAPSFWGPEFPPQPPAVFDDLAPVEAEAEDAYEDEEEEEEEDLEEDHSYCDGSCGQDSCGYNMLTLCYPGAVHVFLSASPDTVSQVEAALSLQGKFDPADSATAPPAADEMLTMTFRGQEYKFDAVTPDEVQEILLSFGGRELMIPTIQLKMVFLEENFVFRPVSPDKVQAVLSLLGGVRLTVSTIVPWALHNQLTEPLECSIYVLDAVDDEVQAVLSLLEGGDLNPGIGGGASASVPYRLFLQSINHAW